MLSVGATILIPSGPDRDPNRKHLHIVIARNVGPPAQVLTVPVCSLGSHHHDDTTVLRTGAHPFIRHDSYIKYSAARIDNEAAMRRGIQSRLFETKENFRQDVLMRIRDGLRYSRFTKPFAKTFLDECG